MNKIYVVATTKGRIDKVLATQLKEDYSFSRSYVQSLIEQSLVKVNNKIITNNFVVQIDQEIELAIPELKPLELTPEQMDLKILYEDEYLLIIDKPNNLVVHPAPGHTGNTLVNGLIYYLNDQISTGSNIYRPGIVHRIDKNTTGILVIAKNDKVHRLLAELFASRNVLKEYLAIVHGVIEENKGVINAPIGRDPQNRKKYVVTALNSKEAVTEFEVIKRFKQATLILCNLKTGRTHQIRVHMSYINHPIVGDNVYGFNIDKNDPYGQYLHSYKIEFIHPINKKIISIICEPPQEFNGKLKGLE